MFRYDDDKDAKATISKLKQIAEKEINDTGGLRDIIRTTNGALVIKFRNSEQKLSVIIKGDGTIKIKDDEIKPKLQITGVGKGMSDEELKEILTTENDDIVTIWRYNWADRLNITTRRNCRNKYKENVLISIDIDMFEYLVKKEKIKIELMQVYTEELIETPICFKCSRI